MTTTVQPYLFFNGRCEEALAFYAKTIGAELLFSMRYKDAPQPMPKGSVPEGWDEKIMHGTVRIGATELMVSDGNKAGAEFEGFSLSLEVATEAEADQTFAALSKGGVVVMPIGKTFWSPRFGMLTDKFGVGWMVTVPGEKKG